MKTGDAVEYYLRSTESWVKGRFIGELSTGQVIVENTATKVTYTRHVAEVRVPKVKVTRWVNVYSSSSLGHALGGGIYTTEDDARSKVVKNDTYIATVPVTWEE